MSCRRENSGGLYVERDTGGISVALNENDNRHLEWSEQGGQSLKNFNGDLYSLVIFLPDHRVFYLKFYSKMPGAEANHGSRGMTGWMISKKGDVIRSSRTAMREDLVDKRSLEAEDWPAEESNKALMPENLPAK